MIITVFATLISVRAMLTPFTLGNVDTLIPLVLHKVDALATGVVFPAMAIPVLAMPRWYVQVHRFAFDDGRPSLYDNR